MFSQALACPRMSSCLASYTKDNSAECEIVGLQHNPQNFTVGLPPYLVIRRTFNVSDFQTPPRAE